MKYLGKLLPLLALTALAPLAKSEDVAKCFAVHDMVKTEAARYVVNAVSHCKQVYDAVYVAVSFLDRRGKHLGNGVWAIYWCRPGRRELQEFGIPKGADGFERVVLRRITTNFAELLD